MCVSWSVSSTDLKLWRSMKAAKLVRSYDSFIQVDVDVDNDVRYLLQAMNTA